MSAGTRRLSLLTLVILGLSGAACAKAGTAVAPSDAAPNVLPLRVTVISWGVGIWEGDGGHIETMRFQELEVVLENPGSEDIEVEEIVWTVNGLVPTQMTLVQRITGGGNYTTILNADLTEDELHQIRDLASVTIEGELRWHDEEDTHVTEIRHTIVVRTPA